MAAIKKVEETVAVELGALLDAGDGAVVTLVAGETRLVVHRAVLATRSPVFEAMFFHDTLEASSGQVTITDVEGPVLRQVLVYMYTTQAPQLPSMVPQLLAAADKYSLSGLKDVCEQQLAAQLAVENAAATAVLAVRHCCPSLTQVAINFIRAHNFQVMATKGWADMVCTQPEDVITVSQLLSEAPAESRTPTIVEGGPTSSHSDHGHQAPDAAAVSRAALHTVPLDDNTISRFRSLSVEEKGRRLLEAAQQAAEGEMRMLLVAGADMAAKDWEGCTALHWAAARGHVEVARCLIRIGAEVNIRTSLQETPLHFAVLWSHRAMVQLLVAHSADPNASDAWGETPLHYAAVYRHGDVVVAAALLEAGADRRARNKMGETPLDLARQKNKQHLFQILTQ